MKNGNKWNILVVDDDDEVHIITRMVLSTLEFKGLPVQLISAYSGKEAMQVLSKNDNIALAIIDVVMETETAGLELVQHIRQTLENKYIRIIIRTGQPGFAPEERVILEYDINDYKEKTELSSRKLITTVITALRSFEVLHTIRKLNEELEVIVQERTKELVTVNTTLAAELQRLKNDQAAGAKTQYKLLPDRHKRYEDYEFSRYLLSSMYLSGDFIDYFEIDEFTLGFYIADVSGHGISSAFVTVMLKNFIDAQLEKHWIGEESLISEPDKLLKKLNKEILRDNLGKYLTMFYGVIDMPNNRLLYANGGQYPHPILYDEGGIRTLEATGSPVGLFRTVSFESHEYKLPSEFALLMISDGILEVLPQPDLDTKMNYIYSLVRDMDVDIDRLIRDLELKSMESLPDDVTFLMIKRRAHGKG